MNEKDDEATLNTRAGRPSSSERARANTKTRVDEATDHDQVASCPRNRLLGKCADSLWGSQECDHFALLIAAIRAAQSIASVL